MKTILVLLLCIFLAVGTVSCELVSKTKESASSEAQTEGSSIADETTVTLPSEESTTVTPPPIENSQNPFDDNGFSNVGGDDETKRY